jgi:alkanesulfonate monooxygenase SsuD/methylene tetrahydromethanopterin reductase-like flavin-dependent oxidoreductase (luciferase family)
MTAQSSSDNKFKIGLFAANCSGGIAATDAKERWLPSWENNVALAQMADAAGIEFMLPLGRWAGYGGDGDHNGISYETLMWSAGLLAATKRIIAFSTLHVAMINPVFAAKQMVTADHIGGGRFGLNIVCGWNADEFGMMGIDLGDHDRRYELGQEWLEIVSKIWSQDEPFDFDGTFYQLKNVRAKPKPISQPRPLVMNAGQSGPGLDFAVRNADYLFRAIQEMSVAKAEVAQVKAQSKALGREVGVFTNAYCVCRPTVKEAEEFHHYYAVENANPDLSDEVKAEIKLRMAGGNSAYPLIGDPDTIAEKMQMLSEIGFSGIAMGLVNYLDELPYFRDEVLPRLERLGLRQPAGKD